MLLPTKCNRVDIKTGAQFEHVYTEEERRQIADALVAGKDSSIVARNIIKNLKPEDWQEVKA